MDPSLIIVAICFCLASANPVKKFPKCDKNLITNIFRYWEGAGMPKDILKLEGVYKAYKSTNNIMYNGISCRTYDFQPDGTIKATYDTTAVTLNVTEKGGLLTFKDHLTYVIYAGTGVIGAYNCCEDKDAPVSKKMDMEDGTILTTEKGDINAITHMQGVLRLLGFRLDKTYKCPK